MTRKRLVLIGLGTLVAIVATAAILFPVYGLSTPWAKDQAFEALVRRSQRPVEHGGKLIRRVSWLPNGDPRRAREFVMFEDGSSWTYRSLYNYAVQGGSYGGASESDALALRKALSALRSTRTVKQWTPDIVLVSSYVDGHAETRAYTKSSMPFAITEIVNRPPKGIAVASNITRKLLE